MFTTPMSPGTRVPLPFPFRVAGPVGFVLFSASLFGCAGKLQRKTSELTGCESEKVQIASKNWIPGEWNWHATCGPREYTCIDRAKQTAEVRVSGEHYQTLESEQGFERCSRVNDER